MPRTQQGPVRLVAITLVALFGLIAAVAPTTAQDIEPDPDIRRHTVAAVLCPDIDCATLGDRLDGFGISAIDEATGEVLDSCVTEAATQAQACVLEVPAGAAYTLGWDDSQIPAGYAYVGYQVNVDDGPLGSITYIPFAPVQAPGPTPTPPVIVEPGHVTVQAALCTDATCHMLDQFLYEFVIIAVDPATGAEFSRCATGTLQQSPNHPCIVDVPHDGGFELQWLANQVPAGYAPFGEPFPVGDPAVLTLGFVPVADDTPVTPTVAPVTRLPSTGTASSDSATGVSPLTLLAASLASALVGLAAMGRPVPARQRLR